MKIAKTSTPQRHLCIFSGHVIKELLEKRTRMVAKYNLTHADISTLLNSLKLIPAPYPPRGMEISQVKFFIFNVVLSYC